MAAFPIPTPATTLNPSASLNFLKPSLLNKLHFAPKLFTSRNGRANRNPLLLLQCTKFSTPSLASETETEEDYNSSEEEYNSSEEGTAAPVNRRRRRRYRKEYPGEKKGITEEMRFVAMKLRNSGKPKEMEIEGTWQPSLEGFLKYLVDTKLVFTTIERIVDDSTDVSYVYFRKTGLERSDCISRDLERLSGEGNVIPQPSNPGITYVQYLEELAEKSPPLFLCHFYNIYFSHIAGGDVIARKVSEMLLGGRELEMYKWEGGDAQDLLRGVREKLNALGEVPERINKSIPIPGADSTPDHIIIDQFSSHQTDGGDCGNLLFACGPVAQTAANIHIQHELEIQNDAVL